MTMKKKTKQAVGVIIGTSVIAVVLLAALLTGILEPPRVPEPPRPIEYIFVDATYLLKTDETNDSVNFTTLWDNNRFLVFI